MNRIFFENVKSGDRVRPVGGGLRDTYMVFRTCCTSFNAMREITFGDTDLELHVCSHDVEGVPSTSIVQLEPGSLVTSNDTDGSYVVTSVHNYFAVAIQTIEVGLEDAEKWDIVDLAAYRHLKD